MPTYAIRFLKPDDTYAKAVISQEFTSDAEVSDFARQHYGQKALEIWEGDRRVVRRVSGAHEARAKGIWPQCCRYPAPSTWSLQSHDRTSGELPFSEFEQLCQASQAIFQTLKLEMARHPIWIRAQAHPAAPPNLAWIRMSFHPSRRDPDGWVGWTTLSVFSPAGDGASIVDDVVDAATTAVRKAHAACPGMTGGDEGPRPKPVLDRGGQITGGLDESWFLTIPPPGLGG
jgi:hypothetical protein